MATGRSKRSINEPRRHDRACDDDWIRAFLRSAAWGMLATVSVSQPFINSNLFVYDEERSAIYLHTARQGRTRSNLDGDGRVCFSAAEMGRILPDTIALEFSVEYASVVVFGRGSVVDDDEQKASALQLLLDKYAPHLKPGRDYRPANQEELDRTSVFRIEIESWSGKQNEKPEDHPGAFEWKAPGGQ
jgi:nitroimidazol reductase NimA-like FMN-containing flavoprotein (pyridoxamine 5'-phosphate oxidase superfamily)